MPQPRSLAPHHGLVLESARKAVRKRTGSFKALRANAAARDAAGALDNGQPRARTAPRLKGGAPAPEPPKWAVVWKEVHGQLLPVKVCPPMPCEGADLTRFTAQPQSPGLTRGRGTHPKYRLAIDVSVEPPSLTVGTMGYGRPGNRKVKEG